MSKKLIVVLVTISVIIGILLFVQMSTVIIIDGFHPVIALDKPIKNGDNYILNVTFVSKEIKPTEVTWYITKENIAIAHGDFPATSGNAGNITNNNITVTWFDNDDSNKISVDDQIRVHKADNALEGCKIRLIYVVTGDTISIQSFTA